MVENLALRLKLYTNKISFRLRENPFFAKKPRHLLSNLGEWTFRHDFRHGFAVRGCFPLAQVFR